MIQVKCEVKGVYVAMNDSATVPAVVLIDGSGRHIPIFIGLWEAISISSAQKEEVPPRPFTHDLFLDLMEKYAILVKSLSIDTVEDGVYYAHLVLSAHNHEDFLDCRPSDGIAVALRAKAPIFVDEELFAAAGEGSNISEMVDLSTFLREA